MIKAKAILCTEAQNISMAEVEFADLMPNDILVKNLYSGVSIGTEFLLIQNKISWGPFPIIPGYQAVGVVEAVGERVEEFKVGDKVYHRGYFAENDHLPIMYQGKAVSSTSAAHSNYVVVNLNHKEHSAAILPEGVDEASASLFVLPSVGLLGVDMADVKVGNCVVVFGVGMIGIGNVAAAKLRGAKVIAIDMNPKRLSIAKSMGADYIINPANGDVKEEVLKIVPNGADVVIEATGNRKCIDTVMSLAKMCGTFVYQGNYGEGQLSFDFYTAHMARLKAVFPCDDGHQPFRRAIMDWLKLGAIDLNKTITHRIDAADAAMFYSDINANGAKDVLGAVIKW